MGWADFDETLGVSAAGVAMLARVVPHAVAEYVDLWRALAACEHVEDLGDSDLRSLRARASALAFYLSMSSRTLARGVRIDAELHTDPLVLRPLVDALVQSLVLISHCGTQLAAQAAGGGPGELSAGDLLATLTLTDAEAMSWLDQPEVAWWLDWAAQQIAQDDL